MKLFKHLFALLCLLTIGMPAMADNTLSVEAIDITDNNVVYIPLNITNSDPIAGFNVTIGFPDFLEVTGSPVKNQDRCFDIVSCKFTPWSGNRYQMVVTSFGKNPFNGNEGEVYSIPVKVKEGTPADTKGEISFSDIVLSSLGGMSENGMAIRYPQDNFTSEVSYKAFVPEMTFTAAPAEAVVNAGSSATFDFNFTTNTDLYGLEVSFQLPEHLSIKETPVLNTTLSPNGIVTLNANANNTYKVMLFDMGNHAIAGNEGTIFTFKVEADENFSAETSEIKAVNIIGAYGVNHGESYYAPDFTITISNGAGAYGRLVELLQTAENTLTQAREAIAEDCPDVKDRFTGDDIAAKIAALKVKVDEAYANGTIIAQESELSEEIQALSADFEKLMSDAYQAESAFKANKANEEAYTRLTELLGTARKSLADTMEAIKEDCPDVAAEFSDNEINAKIDAIAAKINTANQEGKCAFEEDAITKEIQALGADLEKLHSDAVAAEQAFKSNKAAYEQMQEGIQTARQTLTDTMDAIKEDCPDVAANYSDEEIKAMIEALATEVEGYNESKTCVDNLEAFNTKLAAIAEALEALKADAVAAEEKFKSDKAAAENQAAYDRMIALIDMAGNTLKNALETIAESCPDVKDQFTGDEIQSKIDAVKAEADAALDAGTCVDKEADVKTYVGTVTEEIAALINAAVAAEEQFKSDQHQAANEAARDRLTARLAAAREALATTIAQINESCPDVKADYTGAEFTAELDKIAAEIASLYEEGKCADEENSVSESIDAVSNALLAYVEAAKVAQAKFELEARNQKAYDAVINQIDGLQKKLDETAEHVKELYPTAPVQSYIYVAQSAIDAARQGAENALVSANDNGEEFAYSFAADTIEELIAEIEKAAKTLGITEIFGDDVDAGAICDVFTTDGRVVAKGVRAAEIRSSLTNGFYIIATGNKTYKITVK